MNYPVWYLPETGGGFLIALIAIVHVFISRGETAGDILITKEIDVSISIDRHCRSAFKLRGVKKLEGAKLC